ncbi:MAG: prevent-host-death protein [Gluconacetobacter diazotrophicus]|nr:prevent-host-death protein [Gluconacetobacter diazotrophicus]
MDEAAHGRISVKVTRQGSRNDVMPLSETEFASWQETVHLLGNPRNAGRLLRAIREFDRGLATEKDLLPPRA